MGKQRLILQLGWIVLLVGLLAACTAEPDTAATAVGRNSIPVAPDFLDFYTQMGGQRLLGDPITEMFVAEADGRSLQYFQNIRLEYDAARQQISITPLGQWALDGLNQQVLAPTPEDSQTRAFPNTAYTLQDEFLAFYNEHDGETLLGQPISDQLNVDDLRVQYFSNGRLEWRPEAPTNLRVQLSPLGQAHFDNEMRFTYQNSRVDAAPVPSAGVTAAHINAYVKAPILYGGETQTLYVTAQTSSGAPVTGLLLDLTLAFGAESQTITLGPTDDNGQITYPLTTAVPPGEEVTLRLQAKGNDGRIIGETIISFKTWW